MKFLNKHFILLVKHEETGELVLALRYMACILLSHTPPSHIGLPVWPWSSLGLHGWNSTTVPKQHCVFKPLDWNCWFGWESPVGAPRTSQSTIWEVPHPEEKVKDPEKLVTKCLLPSPLIRFHLLNWLWIFFPCSNSELWEGLHAEFF